MLILSLAALLAGPLTFRVARTWPRVRAWLELLIMAMIALLVGVELAPIVTRGGAPSVLSAAVVGLFGPSAVEWGLHRVDYHRFEARTHLVIMLVGLLGLALHGFADGGALTDAARGGHAGFLAGAVVLHRIPVGLAIWWLARPTFGAGIAWTLLGAIGASTVAGYGVGLRVIPSLSPGSVAAFQGFVAGSLLHVVFFRKHIDAHRHPPSPS